MRNCPYCNASGVFDFNWAHRIFGRCSACDLIYPDETAAYEAVLEKYRRDYGDRLIADQLGGFRKELYDHILNLIEQKNKTGSLLDVGTGCGLFIARAKDGGWCVKGMEPSSQSLKPAFKVDIFCGTLNEYPDAGERFDVVTFINVLDLSIAPWQEIRKAGQLLKPDGIVYLRFPNGWLHSRIIRTASRWGLAGRVRKFLVFHQYAFSAVFIRRLLRDSGFADISVRNSPPTSGDPYRMFSCFGMAVFLKQTTYRIARIFQMASGGRWMLGPSLEVVAVKKRSSPEFKTSSP